MTSALLILGLTFVVGVVSYGATPAAEVGKPAPLFGGTDVNGKSITLSDFKGKIVVLEWTNPGCPFVQRVYQQKIMSDLQTAYTKRGIVWLVVNSTNKEHRDYQAPESLKKTFVDWASANTAILMDAEGTIGKLYDARTTPHMFIIDSKGTLVYNGAVDDDARGSSEKKISYVKTALDELLAGKSVTTSSTKPYGCSVKY